MIDAIIEFMTTYHAGSRGGAYGWVYVAVAASGIFGALAAREFRARRRRASTEVASQAATAPLSASAVIDLPSGQRRVDAIIRASATGYELVLRDSSVGPSSEVVHAFATIQQLEQHLEHKTVLRLGDFRAG
jgi:hypothetical protein